MDCQATFTTKGGWWVYGDLQEFIEDTSGGFVIISIMMIGSKKNQSSLNIPNSLWVFLDL
ncbi:hypothetical protein [Fodinibius roseus]|uniref:hypothetical protein n=1 Tax=Fodinibius roseus TaxID=1194090 RepID=UPI001114CA17|nr:hypothetical protein [Fodinibius roseus]